MIWNFETMLGPCSLTSSKTGPFSGLARVPGDKSISHRSIIFGSLALGETLVSGLLEGEDVLNTVLAMRQLGAKITHDGGLWRLQGVGLGGLREPDSILDMGNSGTSARLMSGLIAGHPITVCLTGDRSLVKRPMKRVMTPLEQMGATFLGREGGRLPMAIRGVPEPTPITYEMPVASAQVKSAILLAGLTARGNTTVLERWRTRDHTENMLRHFGVTVTTEQNEDIEAISVQGQEELTGCAVDVPSDPSSAAFPVVAAILSPGSKVRFPGVCINPRRFGLFETLLEMGAHIVLENKRIQCGEQVADLIVEGGHALKGVDVPPERVPGMIDEFPILAVAASCVDGETRMTGLGELRVKESDRLAMMAAGLRACGVDLEEGEDSLTIRGTGRPPQGGVFVETALDHRIAMSFLVLGCVSQEPISIDDASPINTSFPRFADLMNGLGANIHEPT